MTGPQQISFQTMGGETVNVKPRGKHYIQPRGYADYPGAGPKDETCGSCKHIYRDRRWSKCMLSQARWTGGRKSDILAGAAACSKWEAA